MFNHSLQTAANALSGTCLAGHLRDKEKAHAFTESGFCLQIFMSCQSLLGEFAAAVSSAEHLAVAVVPWWLLSMPVNA